MYGKTGKSIDESRAYANTMDTKELREYFTLKRIRYRF